MEFSGSCADLLQKFKKPLEFKIINYPILQHFPNILSYLGFPVNK